MSITPMNLDTHSSWMADRWGMFTSSETIRLMAGCDDPVLLDGTKLELAVKAINSMDSSTFSKTSGQPYIKDLRAALCWSDEITAPQAAYAFKMREGEQLPEGAKTYAEEKAVELMTEFKIENELKVPHILWGKEQEVNGIEQYAIISGVEVLNVGEEQQFITKCKDSGGTPDAIIVNAQAGGIEAKCPNSVTHANYRLKIKDAASLKAEELKYYWQVMDQMRCTDASQWIFLSYDPRFQDDGLHLHSVIIERNDDDIAKIEKRLAMAVEYRDSFIAKVEQGNG